MKARIVEHYAEIALARESQRNALNSHPFALEKGSEGIAWAAEQIGKLIKGGKFFEDHDYAWATQINSYRNPLEAALQLFALKALSEVDRSHPHYGMLSHVCVRVSPVSGANAYSFESEGYRYAVISNGLLKLFWEFLHAFDTLKPRPNRYSEIPGTNPLDCNWSEAKAARCAKVGGKQLDNLIATSAAYAFYKTPSHISAHYKHPSAAKTDRARYMGATVMAADSFVLLHEVGHLLNHGAMGGSRILEHELQADDAALSLMIILAARELFINQMYFNGIALALISMRHANLIGRICRYSSSLEPNGVAFDKEIEKIYEEELDIRSKRISASAAMMGLPIQRTQTFDVIYNEMFFTVEATKLRLLRKMRENRSA